MDRAIYSKSGPKVLWLEDDNRIIEILRSDLESFCSLKNIKSLNEFKKLSIDDLLEYHAVLVDMNLLDGEVGLSVVQYLKNENLKLPILMLTNDESVDSRLASLSMGADDYLWKAMPVEEMILRIGNAIKRFYKLNIKMNLTLGSLEILPLKFMVYQNQNEINLSKIEMQFLTLLISQHPKSVTCDDLRSEVWRLPSVEVGTINTFIWKLNKKLNDWEYRISKDQEFVQLTIKE
jgi:DNA-binding response OmpR family regulator